MTILPKKKQTKEKNESEKSSDTHSVGHSATSDPNRGARRANSPPRWIPQNSLDDRLPSHEVGNRRFQDEFSSHDGGANHNKRRHRSSPHRSVRKHRHERTATGTGRTSPPSQAPRSTGSPPSTPSPTEGDTMEEEMNTGYNSEDEYGEARNDDDELERWFEDTLRRRGLMIKRMGEDGACLFRSVADQVFGDQEMHSIVRRSCVDYMAKNADFFKQYVTEEFSSYLRRKRIDNCHGNHLEMQAMSELYNRPIEVYQYGPEPINTFHGQYKTDNDPIRLSYHKNIHYNSIVDPYKATIGVGLGLPGYEPGAADRNLMSSAMKASEETQIEKTMLEDKMRETDWELTQETLEEQVARESYLQWLRDNEKRASRQNLQTRTASATCSSARESTSRSSPRTRSANNSGPNSPNRVESAELPLPTGMDLQQPATPPPGPSSDRCPTPEGATGGAGLQIPETSSLMNDLYSLPEWDEQDILAQVIAQSQQEYLDKLKTQSTSAGPHHEDQTPSTSTGEGSHDKSVCQASTSSAPSCSGIPYSSCCNEKRSGNS